MQYDPIKNTLRGIIGKRPFLRKLFYRALGVLFLREWYVKKRIRGLELERKSPLSILDAGSGFGQYAYYCVRRFPKADVFGIELDSGHVADCTAFAKKCGLGTLKFGKGDLAAFESPGTFDLILLVDVLEHMKDDAGLLARLRRSLKEGGALICTTPAAGRRHHQDAGFVEEHMREGYTPEEIHRLFAKAGFHDTVIEYGYGFWGDLAWRTGIRNTMRLAGRGLLGKGVGFLYLALVFPFMIACMALDFFTKNKRGTGLIIEARAGEAGP